MKFPGLAPQVALFPEHLRILGFCGVFTELRVGLNLLECSLQALDASFCRVGQRVDVALSRKQYVAGCSMRHFVHNELRVTTVANNHCRLWMASKQIVKLGSSSVVTTTIIEVPVSEQVVGATAMRPETSLFGNVLNQVSCDCFERRVGNVRCNDFERVTC